MEPLVKGHKLAKRYTLIQLLHTSEHSQVWLAHDGALRSRVALKVARSREATDRKLLRNDFDMSGRCRHPAVVRVYDFHDDDDHTLLAMEYLSGGRIGDLIGRAPAQFLPPMIELAEGLAFVHKQGIVHRDVKLSNGMLDSHGHARLIDFGVASVKGENGLRSGGSPRSMSPQQRGGHSPDPSDDLYAFGVALHRLVEERWPDDRSDSPRKATGHLANLIDSLLSHDSSQRPADMEDVAASLRAALAEQSNVTLPPDEFELESRVIDTSDEDSVERIEVVAMDSAQGAGTPPPATRSRARTLGLLAVYGIVGAVALFYFLPKLALDFEPDIGHSAAGQSAASPGSGQASTAVPAAASVEPWKLAQQAKERKEAEQMLERLLERQFYLEDESASVWAPDEFERIKALAIEGDQAFRKNDFTTALARYTEGKTLADTLAERASTVLDDTLSAAANRLASADGAEATRLYQLALAVDPTSVTAQRGLERAGNLDQVLTLVSEGEALEQAGQISEARTAFQRALDLDAEWQPAQAGVARVQRALANSAYSRRMSEGFAALERGDFSSAQESFEQAGRLRPGDSDVTAAMQQLDTAIRLREVNRLESRAAELERQGDLRGAEREYKALLERSPSQTTAAAMRRVREHAEVDEQLDELLSKPSRLANDSVFRNAQDVLERVDPYLSDPRISERTARLRELMQSARIPQAVQLVSDGATDILVYRVGRLGTVTRETLNLRPGEYTAVGTREGFRDVRVTFEVAPGGSVPPVEVICRERI